MYDSLKIDIIKEEYKHLRSLEVRPKWVEEAGSSEHSILESFVRNNIISGTKAVESIKELLNEVKPHMISRSSSMDVYEALISGKYDRKLVIYTGDKKYIANYVESYTLDNGVYLIRVMTDQEYNRKAPTEYVKKLDWIYENFQYIFIQLTGPRPANKKQ